MQGEIEQQKKICYLLCWNERYARNIKFNIYRRNVLHRAIWFVRSNRAHITKSNRSNGCNEKVIAFEKSSSWDASLWSSVWLGSLKDVLLLKEEEI